MSRIVPFSQNFPTEIFVHIFLFASPSTLAVCAQLNHSFFALAAFRLWKEVELFEARQVHRLFQRHMKRYRSQLTPLLPFLEHTPHLSLRTIQHLTLDGSLLRTCISLSPGFGDPLVPQRMVVTNVVEVSSPFNSIFQKVQPLELVFVCKHGTLASKPPCLFDPTHVPSKRRTSNIIVVLQPLSEEVEWKIIGMELLNLVVGIAVSEDEVNIVNNVKKDLLVRFVLKPSSYQEGFERFLEVRRERNCLDGMFLRGREGSVVVEVGDEKAKRWVESGKFSLSEEQKKLVKVEVGEKGWEHWVGYK